MIISQFPNGGSVPSGLPTEWKRLGVVTFSFSGTQGIAGNQGTWTVPGAQSQLWDLSQYWLYAVTDGSLFFQIGANTGSNAGSSPRLDLFAANWQDPYSPGSDLLASLALPTYAATSGTITLASHYVLCSAITLSNGSDAGYGLAGVSGLSGASGMKKLGTLAGNAMSNGAYARPGRIIGMLTNTSTSDRRSITSVSGSLTVWGYKEG